MGLFHEVLDLGSPTSRRFQKEIRQSLEESGFLDQIERGYASIYTLEVIEVDEDKDAGL